MENVLLAMAMIFLAGCASRGGPVFYPNDHLQRVGEAQVQKDVSECEVLAERYVKSDAGVEAAKNTAVGGAGGAVIGGAAGAVTGNLGRGIGVGAATGAATGLVHSMIRGAQPTPVFKNFMFRCLQERGYETVGWK